MNALIQERHHHSEMCITVKVSRRLQKFEIYFSKEGSGLAFFSMDLGHIFKFILGNEFGVMLREKVPIKPECANDLVHMHSFMIYTKLIEYNIVGDKKTPLLQCFHFIPKLQPGDIETTVEYMTYQSFSHLQFRPLHKIFFPIAKIDLRGTRGEKNPLYLSVPLVLF